MGLFDIFKKKNDDEVIIESMPSYKGITDINEAIACAKKDKENEHICPSCHTYDPFSGGITQYCNSGKSYNCYVCATCGCRWKYRTDYERDKLISLDYRRQILREMQK